MQSKANLSSAPSASDRREYFYDMLDQLLIIGQQAGGDALIDATLIGGLLASRRAQNAAESTGKRHTA